MRLAIKRLTTQSVFDISGIYGVWMAKSYLRQNLQCYSEIFTSVLIYSWGFFWAHAQKPIFFIYSLTRLRFRHPQASLVDFYGEKEGKRIWNKFDVHYTPVHGSWLNQAEIAINIYSRQCLGKSKIPTIAALRKKTKFWNHSINGKGIT